MKIDILTLFPQMMDALQASIIGKAIEKGIVEINSVNIRDYSLDKHKKCDDYPFGGGAGMIMTPQPVVDSIQATDPNHNALRIYLSPKGKVLNNKLAKELAVQKHLVLLCGHYEGIDQRALDLCIDMEVSIGDYILTGGELAAMVLVDALCRYIPDVLGGEEATKEESFSENRLEHPQYTRPQDFRGLKVPDVLISGNHANVAKWKSQQQLEITKSLRPDLLVKEK